MQFGSKMVKINKKRIDFVCDVEKMRKGFEILCLMRYKLYCFDQTFVIKILKRAVGAGKGRTSSSRKKLILMRAK